MTPGGQAQLRESINGAAQVLRRMTSRSIAYLSALRSEKMIGRGYAGARGQPEEGSGRFLLKGPKIRLVMHHCLSHCVSALDSSSCRHQASWTCLLGIEYSEWPIRGFRCWWPGLCSSVNADNDQHSIKPKYV